MKTLTILTTIFFMAYWSALLFIDKPSPEINIKTVEYVYNLTR